MAQRQLTESVSNAGLTSRRSSARIVAALIAALIMLAGCSEMTSGSAQDTAPGKYEQTWPTSYDRTSCTDWQRNMNSHQRWAAAADMLVGARSYWNIDDMPDDELVDKFEDGISRTCQASSSAMIDKVATTLAMMGGLAVYGH